MKTWQWKLIAATALLYVTAGTVLLALVLTLTYSGEQHIQAVQHTNTKTNQTTSSELKQLKAQNASLKAIVSNEAATSAYLKSEVQGLTSYLIYTGQAFSATCKAEPGCVIPPYPPATGATP